MAWFQVFWIAHHRHLVRDPRLALGLALTDDEPWRHDQRGPAFRIRAFEPAAQVEWARQLARGDADVLADFHGPTAPCARVAVARHDLVVGTLVLGGPSFEHLPPTHRPSCLIRLCRLETAADDDSGQPEIRLTTGCSSLSYAAPPLSNILQRFVGMRDRFPQYSPRRTAEGRILAPRGAVVRLAAR